MEGTLLTVEETVELAPVSTPAPRRRAPRSRATAKPAAENPADGGAEQEAVATLEITPDRAPAIEAAAPAMEAAPALESAASDSNQEAIALGEPEPTISVDVPPVPEAQTSDAAGAEAPEI